MESYAAYVEDATDFAKRLAVSEMRFPGDHGLALRRLARQVGVRWTVLKNLHYRAPKQIDVADFVALGTACGQRKLYEGARADAAPRTTLGRVLVGAADALARAADALDS